MVRPELAVELRTALHHAKKQEIAVRKEGIRVQRDGHPWDVCLEVVPIKSDLGERFFLILFQETPAREPAGPEAGGQAPASGTRQSREDARLRRDLQATKESLQSMIQEQEAINEELKSANEEALSSNEELQSTNEELETAKEELQSTNEELVTVNEQLGNRNFELAQLNDDLTNLLSSVNIPILMLSGDWRIRRFTPQAEKLLNLLPGDVGRPIVNLRPNIDVPDLASLVTEVVDTMSVREREVQDREGRWYSMRVRPYRTMDNKIDGAVMTFIDIDAAKRIHLELQREQTFTAAVLESAAALVMVTDLEGHIARFNLACRRLSEYSFEEVEGKPVWDVLVPPEEIEAVKQVYKELAESRSAREHENHWVDRSGQRHLISWSSTVVTEAQGRHPAPGLGRRGCYRGQAGRKGAATNRDPSAQPGATADADSRPGGGPGGGAAAGLAGASRRHQPEAGGAGHSTGGVASGARNLARRTAAANWGSCRSRWRCYRRISAALPATFTPSC